MDTAKDTPTRRVELPQPTAWPIVFAFGLTTMAAGLITGELVCILGGILTVAGIVGWFRAVLPHEAYEYVPVEPDHALVTTARPRVERIALAPGVNRAWLPLESYPISAGLKGGLAGGVAMALLAVMYGFLSQKSIWYPINLLVAGFFPNTVSATTAQLAKFSFEALLIAIPLHLIISLTVGLLYGATLPMFPRRPILLGGLIGPIVWSGLVYTILGLVNPVLDKRINWFWFALSQVGFGLVAGIIVSRQERVRTAQAMPFSIRAGVESPGLWDELRGEDKRP